MNSIARSGLTLAAIAAICTLIVVVTWQTTRNQIVANERAWLEQSLVPALGDVEFDSGLLESRIDIPEPHELPAAGPATVYRVYSDGKPAAALFVLTARDGYAGPIRFLLGLRYDGRVTGIRILEHRETPGLGDFIEAAKSDWGLQFTGRSLGDPAITGWAIRADEGEFDQLTGASVTPRAIIKAMQRTLLYFDANRDTVFAASASQGSAP
ncbi:MAG: RnfABCDGE type electron transport complex subunit G [Woeseiaceae bacterium]|nr:RnfABCDGE type electron transport complex subunit G [Woeseiaceae bacterium]